MLIDWKKIESELYMSCVNRQQVVLVRGEGNWVWDDDGKKYLDFTSGWAVNNVGHSNEDVASAISLQAKTLLQTSNQFYTVPQLELAEILISNSIFNRVFFSNSGAEANEGAFKLARKYGKINLNGAYEIITAKNSFHGRTLATWSATGKPHDEDVFQPLPSGFIHVEYNNIEAIKSATTNKTAAILLEPVQGEGGVNIPDDDYFKQVRKWCDENNLLFMMDEVQTGMGRLGSLFGYEKFNAQPDVITLAKGLGGGVPIGAILSNRKASVFEPKSEHGSTFGGNALTCAAAYASTKYIIDKGLCKNTEEIGAYLGSRLLDLKNRNSFIKDVRGMGLLWGVEFDIDVAPSIYLNCNETGVLLGLLSTNAVRIMPCLTINQDEIDEGIKRFEDGLNKTKGDLI
ncbi:MAG: aspartate aminotransferase family protein [SAR202 cluster bacterium]|nr:aspartate aminotransferase family protein [SAR202 cluster bacterium]|tara:strand:+ start:16807 stop:18009 length:1203 start_codon:yes stop_codon:yes gene_type:complete